MSELARKLNNFLTRELWRIDLSSLNRFRASLIQLIRLVYTIIRESSERELTLRAMSLVYTTLLSIVPLLAFSFSILKAFGVVDSQLEPLLNKFLIPLGEKGFEITHKILEFVKNLKVGVLGIIGLLLLIYTVISLINKIEQSLNHIWKINKGRSFARRFSDYISIILIGPVFIFAIFGLTANLLGNTVIQKISSMEPIGGLIALFTGELLSYIVVVAIFTFIYVVIPNAKVNFRSALLGGVLAGFAWQAIGWIFAKFVVTSANYAAIYSSFAVLILFLIWLYLSWLILLIGAEVSYCHQNLKFLSLEEQALQISNRLQEKLALIIMYLIGYNFYNNKERWTVGSLVDYLELPHQHIQDTLMKLENQKLILETGENEPAYIPARSIETIKLSEIIDAARKDKEDRDLSLKEYNSLPEVNVVADKIDDAIQRTLGGDSLKSLMSSDRTSN